jgi:protein-S-isoprenylcysteine O-methyltransferase Ste14
VIPERIVAAAFIVSGATFIVFAQLARRRAVSRRGGSLRVSAGLAQLVPYFFWVPYAVVFFRLGPELDVPDAGRVAGVLLTAAGVALALWAIGTLGRHYDLVLEIHAGHRLVRRGPFRWTRHPVYSGLILHFLGACLATGSVLLAAGTIFVTIPAFVARARAEEALLRGEFGAEYDRYRDEVPMLVPGMDRLAARDDPVEREDVDPGLAGREEDLRP